MVFDRYTNQITFFGTTAVGRLDPNTFAYAQKSGLGSNFDQGAPDGKGHALIADPGTGAIAFIDYRKSGDITNPNFFTEIGGFGGIDDVAPSAGLGSQTPAVPEPSSLCLLTLGTIGVAGYCIRRPQ
jgi:hypothetical protein